MIQEAIKTFQDLLKGHELSIELEEAVMRHLEPTKVAFDRRETYDPRKMQQWLTSRDSIKRWKQELAAYAVALNELKKLT